MLFVSSKTFLFCLNILLVEAKPNQNKTHKSTKGSAMALQVERDPEQIKELAQSQEGVPLSTLRINHLWHFSHT